ncbi:MAG: hypothetical protein ACOX20_10695 [Limnochordia bacterium]
MGQPVRGLAALLIIWGTMGLGLFALWLLSLGPPSRDGWPVGSAG